MKIKAYAALAKGQELQHFEFDPGPLGDDQVEINVQYCGICHSDLSMIDNAWGLSAYPQVGGHEVIGTISAVGPQVKHLKPGHTVGMGWHSGSDLICPQCLNGDHNLCSHPEETIVHRHGGFAERVRCQALWAIPFPAQLAAAKAGPLFCGGIAVFNPMVQTGLKPTDRAGVVGIGGLGHLALQFLNKWGCEVFAFTSTESKQAEAKRLGAHHAVDSRDATQLEKIAGSLDYLIVTVNVPLDWNVYLKTLRPRGRLHFVGAVLAPLGIAPAELVNFQGTISGSPVGSPGTIMKMLEFCARHHIEPVTETFPMSRINEAFEHLRSGKARYRIVLTNDIQ